ncbi:MAG: hypothetical protein RMZ41_023300 [Nostoc sp. DedVER02]
MPNAKFLILKKNSEAKPETFPLLRSELVSREIATAMLSASLYSIHSVSG